MGVLQISANRAGAGKTCLISAILINLAEQGKKMAYYKPFSVNPDHDRDVSFISQGLLPEGSLLPVPSPRAFPEISAAGASLDPALAQQIADEVSSLDSAADLTLIEGPDLTFPDNGQSSSWAAQLAALVNAKVLLLIHYAKNINVDEVGLQAETLEERLAGLVVNSGPVYRRHEISQTLVEPLRELGIPVWGAIPEDRFMLAVTVQQIADHLGGSWVQEPENTDAPVDRFLIGGNIMDSGSSYFGRYQNQAVITRAERPDIQMASLMCDTKCLVLTGGSQPTEYIQVEADRRGVPLLSVVQDTISTAESLGGLLEQANPHSIDKVRRFAELMHQHLDMEALTTALMG